MKVLKEAEHFTLKPKPTTRNFRDLEGRRIGKFYVVGYLGKQLLNGNAFWLLHCDCGNFRRATTQKIVAGRLNDCGCMKELQKRADFYCKK